MMSAFTKKLSLFGGTLRSAGLACAATIVAPALADFEPAAPPPFGPPTFSEPNQLHIFAYNTAGAEVDELAYSFDATFLPPQSYVGPGIAIAAFAHATAMSASIAVTDSIMWNGYAAVLTVQWFEVATAKLARFEWEIEGVSTGGAYVYQLGIGAISPVAGMGSSGSALMTFMPGERYVFVGQMALFGIEGDGFATLVNVPGPASLAMIGIGLFAFRGRRV